MSSVRSHRFCGMRRPSLVVQQNDDDLSRLASSPVDNITFSTAHSGSSSGPNSSSSSSTTSSSSPSASAINRSVVAVVPEDKAVVEPKKSIELEWHQNPQNQNHRKRKERLDSTSSNSQTDSKVVRSSNEQLGDKDEDKPRTDDSCFKRPPEQQPLLEVTAVEEKSSQGSPVKSHHPHVVQHNLSSVSHHQYHQQSLHKKSNGGGSSGSNNGSVASLSHLAWSNNVTGDDHYSDGEHERRRSSERFCRSRAPHGRKSSSCSAAKKSSSSGLTGAAVSGANGGRYISRRHHNSNSHNTERESEKGGQGYKYDMSNLKMERRGFVCKDGQQIKDTEVKTDTPQQMEVAASAVETSPVAPLPWNEFPDETPVVCPRFAENTFDHVINVSDKFIKINPPAKKENSIKYVNNENMKTRDIMKKYGSLNTNLHNNNNNNNNSSWSKNRNGGDLRLMIITPDERMRQISGRLTKLKKRIVLYEDGFERDFGHRPDKVDTMNDKAMKTIMSEIQKLKKERQVIKTCDQGGVSSATGGGLVTPISGISGSNMSAANSMFGGLKEIVQDSQHLSGDMKISKMQETLTDIEMVLQERRKEDSRVEALDKLSMEQLLHEKTAVQKGLLYLEGMFGRPNSKEERDLARPLYDRYRQIKRMLNRNSSMISAPADLPTILEHEAMLFTSTNNTPSTDATPPESQAEKQEDSEVIKEPLGTDDSSSLNDNLHQLSIAELWHQLDIVRDEKKMLRRTIKEFEQQFEADAGRKMLKGDRKAKEETYALYKQKKGRLRLLDALVKKHMAY